MLVVFRDEKPAENTGMLIVLEAFRRLFSRKDIWQVRILRFLEAPLGNGLFATQDVLAEIVGISRKSIIQNMKKLQKSGMIRRIGADKNGYWEVVGRRSFL